MSTDRGGERAQETTGRSVIVFSDDLRGDGDAIATALRAIPGVRSIVSSADYREVDLHTARDDQAIAIAFATLGIAVVALDPRELKASLAAGGAARSAIAAIEPERIMHAIETEPAANAAQFADDEEFTWGLRATGADTASATGRGIRVAVLDTGIDLEHPDFAGRAITSESFITGVPAQDGHGHGTHCSGTACGPAKPSSGRRYGVAGEADIFAGKVLNDAGSGSDAGILAGIEWAITNGCQVVSMSLGANVREVSAAYETVGRRALEAGCLIVAAAGNNARRSAGNLGFVGRPANSPSIMAVAAVDADLDIADFSARSNPVPGGQVDIAGPGVAVYSSWPLPRRNHTLSGTSMATTHVAGLAALWSQQTGTTARALWDALLGAVRELELPAADAGAGLVQAPPGVESSPMRRGVTVTVADLHAAMIDEVAERLREAGMQVDQVLGTLGVITGSVDAERITVLEHVVGVAAVEEQTAFRIAPPDADVQ